MLAVLFPTSGDLSLFLGCSFTERPYTARLRIRAMTAAITEMLMQSQDAAISLLPALPNEWASGKFRGVRTRGGFELEFEWKDKRIARLKVTSKAGGTFRLRSESGMEMTVNGTRRTMVPKNGTIEFATAKGAEYLIQIK